MSTAEFVEILGQFAGLKNGVSGSRIKKLTDIAINNVELEAEIVDRIFNNLKTIQNSHKLGALYIIDSIARSYKSRADAEGETIGPDAPEGTYAHALFTLNGLITEAVDLTVPTVSNDQKAKLAKLLDIWKKAGAFNPKIIETLKDKYFGNSGDASTTPPPPPPPAQDQAHAQPRVDSNALLASLTALTAANPQFQQQPQPQPQMQGQAGPYPGQYPPASVPGQVPVDPNAQQAMILQMLQQLQADGKLPTIAQPQHQPPQMQHSPQPVGMSYDGSPTGPSGRSRFKNSVGGSQADAFNNFKASKGGRDFRDRDRDRDNGFSRRNRDRSPRRGSDKKSLPPAGHVLGERNTLGTPHYREKHVTIDQTLPSGTIKVLSRTLFIGGVSLHMSEQELASILRPFAEVQSVILNNERKHAFVKVYSRKEAENVIANFNKNSQYNLRTRWGVGFGPRDCCDYQHGISIVPISRLTDADTRWINAAEWGGIGQDRPLIPGLVMEEPDIEIGEGISSKAISQKMPTDGSRNGPRSTKPGEPDDIYTDPLNQANLPSFMQGDSKANPLANLFGGQQAGAAQSPMAPAMAPAMASNNVNSNSATAASTDNAQLSNLMAFLQSQQK